MGKLSARLRHGNRALIAVLHPIAGNHRMGVAVEHRIDAAKFADQRV